MQLAMNRSIPRNWNRFVKEVEGRAAPAASGFDYPARSSNDQWRAQADDRYVSPHYSGRD